MNLMHINVKASHEVQALYGDNSERDFLKPASRNAAGLDLRATHAGTLEPGCTQFVGTGIFLGIPHGYCGLLLPRSGLGAKGISLGNSPGLIDADYRGEVKLILRNYASDMPFSWSVGDRLAQIVFIRCFEPFINMVDELDNTERGEGGFGSTGGVTKT